MAQQLYETALKIEPENAVAHGALGLLLLGTVCMYVCMYVCIHVCNTFIHNLSTINVLLYVLNVFLLQNILLQYIHFLLAIIPQIHKQFLVCMNVSMTGSSQLCICECLWIERK